MASRDQEYLEYKSRANDTFSKSKEKIRELKAQLANMDLSNSKDMTTSIFQESPVKAKPQREVFAKREEMETDERMYKEEFKQNISENMVDLDEVEEIKMNVQASAPLESLR